VRAADKASGTFANREAIALYEQALEAAGHLGDAVVVETRMRIHEAEANLDFMLSDFAGSHAEGERLLELARRAGDRVKEGTALVAMALASLWALFERALAESQLAIGVAEPIDAEAIVGAAHFTTGFVLGVTSRLDEAQREMDQAPALSRAAGDKPREALAPSVSAMIKDWEGHYGDASGRRSMACGSPARAASSSRSTGTCSCTPSSSSARATTTKRRRSGRRQVPDRSGSPAYSSLQNVPPWNRSPSGSGGSAAWAASAASRWASARPRGR
jgi:hypothetical protein